MIYVVLGMHKSGTTLVSRILHSSGIDMGEFDPAIHYDHGNKYERAESLALDLELLRTDSYDVLDLPDQGPSGLKPAQEARMVSLIESCSREHRDWGMKDPRMCLTYHLWARILPPHKLIIVFRDPSQVWPRFKWRGKRGIAINLGRAYTYQRIWIAHNRRILDALGAGNNDSLVLSYHDLMTNDREFVRLQDFVGRELADLRKPDLYRNRSEPDSLLKLSGWWLREKTGMDTAETFAELAGFRSRQLEAPNIR